MFNLLATTLFHMSFLLLSASVLLLLVAWSFFRKQPRRWATRAEAIGATLLSAVVGTLAIGACWTQKSVTGAKLIPVPFLLARTIGDGTGADVLRHDCPTAHYTTCRFTPRPAPDQTSSFFGNNDKGTAWVMLPLDQRFAVA